jgi:hypothetical protein
MAPSIEVLLESETKRNMKMNLFLLIMLVIVATSCGDKSTESTPHGTKSKHHLNIPENGIESMMEANSQKIIEGTDGSIIVSVGEVTRKKADISIRRNDKIIDERLLEEKESIAVDYEGRNYTVLVKNIKKPLVGAGKVELKID